MKFAHIADCHLGAWREPRLQKLNIRAFEKAINECVKEKVNFVLITGDLFDTVMPGIDILKVTALKLKELRDSNIDCYIIPGSHDYSASGKTFLDVFENAGLLKNVAKFYETEKGIELELLKKGNLLIAGLPGRKAGLEKELIKRIIKKEKKEKETQNYFKILALHTMITEAKPKELEFLESISLAELPDDFNYYALGHLHKSFQKAVDGKFVAYPGPLFPTSFDEFEELKKGSFFIINADENNIEAEKREIKLVEVCNLVIDANNKSPEQVTQKALNQLKNIKNNVITLRFQGELARGKTADINFTEIAIQAEKNNNILLRSTSALTSREFKIEVEIRGKSIEQIETEAIEKYEQKEKQEEYKEFAPFLKELVKALDIEKQEGEANIAFEKRISDEASKVLRIKLK